MLEAALVARLSTLAPNLYPIEAPKNYATPCVVYNRLLTKPVVDLSNEYDNAWVYEQIDIYDPDYMAVIALGEQVRKSLTKWHDDDVQAVIWEDEQHFVDTTTETTLYRVGLRIVVMANLSN